jgi:hypothetical protein
MGHRDEEPALFRGHHVIAVEAEAQRAEHLGPQRDGHARESSESLILLDLRHQREVGE